MTNTLKGLTIELLKGGYDRGSAIDVVKQAGLPQALGKLAPGPFGTASRGVASLEALVDAVDLSLAAALSRAGKAGDPSLVSLFIGPEGGFTASGNLHLRSRGVVPVTLGGRHHILRARRPRR